MGEPLASSLPGWAYPLGVALILFSAQLLRAPVRSLLSRLRGLDPRALGRLADPAVSPRPEDEGGAPPAGTPPKARGRGRKAGLLHRNG